MIRESRNDGQIKGRNLISPAIGLVLIVLLGIAVRLWGLDFGLPQRFHPDEPVVVTRAEYGVATNDWNPRAFHWPSMQIYLLGLEYEIWYWTGRALGIWGSADPDFISYALHAPGGFYYLGRLTTLIFGAGCIWLIWLLALRFVGLTGAMVAAFLAAIDPILVRHSRYVTPDIPSEFFFLAALVTLDWLHVLISRRDREGSDTDAGGALRLALISGALIGIGGGTKYPVLELAIPLLAIILLSRSLKASARFSIAIRAAIAVGAAFLITTPYALLDWRKFLLDLSTIGHHLRTGHIGMEAKGGIWVASAVQLVRDGGWAWLIIGGIGAGWLLLRNPRRTWPILLALVLVIAGFVPLQVFSDRYLVPLTPFIVIGIGLLVQSVCEWIGRRNHAVAAVAILVATGLIGAWGITVTGKEAYRLTLPDTRGAALSWVIQNIPAGSSVVEEQGGPDLYAVELAPLAPEPTYRLVEITPMFSRGGEEKDPLDRLIEARPEWVITSSQVRERYMRPGAEKEFPELVAAFKIYYSLIDGYLEEVARFSPGGGIEGPEIVVYRVPAGLWDRVMVGSTSVGEALE
jgi:4-amino-4-deoxy-L-arabinose transferase-like glycosyltransferase